MEPYRIALADDHVLLRRGLSKLLEGEEDFEVIGEASDGLELLELLKSATPHLVVLDISMPKLRGIEAIREIKVLCPEAKVLILTMHSEVEYLQQAMSAGADGYLLKEDANTELFAAIRKLREGKIYVSPNLGEEMMQDWATGLRSDLGSSLQPHPLTPRERQIVKLVAEGRSSREIADLLYISVRTAENHRANIMNKLRLRNAVDLAKYALKNNYV